MEKNNYLIIGTILITIVALFFYKQGTLVAPDNIVDKESIQEMLREYLNKEISKISPQKEVLGGKFYITKLELIDNDSVLIEYEDGHIALQASFDFAIKDGKISISNFKIKQETEE